MQTAFFTIYADLYA